MTNFEYWKDKILEINEENENVAIINGKPVKCSAVKKCGSGECELYTNFIKSCRQNFVEWLYSEHEDKPKLTKRERKLCEALETGWIAANKSGDVYWCSNLPVKSHTMFQSTGGDSIRISGAGFHFDFIDFEDEEPWMVENLLQLEVEE